MGDTEWFASVKIREVKMPSLWKLIDDRKGRPPALADAYDHNRTLYRVRQKLVL